MKTQQANETARHGKCWQLGLSACVLRIRVLMQCRPGAGIMPPGMSCCRCALAARIHACLLAAPARDQHEKRSSNTQGCSISQASKQCVILWAPGALAEQVHTSAQRKLGILGHGIALVQDDQLELVAALQRVMLEGASTHDPHRTGFRGQAE